MFKIIITRSIMLSIFVVIIGWAVFTGLEKEAHRQQVMQERNCDLYGDAINNYYGKEVC